jgi:hypothetical protein
LQNDSVPLLEMKNDSAARKRKSNVSFLILARLRGLFFLFTLANSSMISIAIFVFAPSDFQQVLQLMRKTPTRA